MIRRLLLCSLTLGLLGCSEVAGPLDDLSPSPSEGVAGGVSLVVVQDQYAHLDTLEARLLNDSDRSIGYNLCLSWRERRDEGEWQRIEPLRLCTAELRTLKPGETATWREPVDPSWGTVRYRLGTAIWPEGEDRSVEVVSGEFGVSQ